MECLRRFPDFFLSEEVSAVTPGGNNVHVGVYGIDDRHHCALQARRNDFSALVGYIREHDLVASVNHIFSSLTGRRSNDDYGYFASYFPVVETLNGHLPHALNQSAAAFALDWRKASVGGSDAHTLEGLGRTYTEIRGARTIEEFLTRLRAGHGQACGESGSYWKVTRAVWCCCCSMIADKPWTTVLAPLGLFVPLITMGNLVQEHFFNYRWSRRVQSLAKPLSA